MRSANRASISLRRDRRGEHDAALRGAAGKLGDGEERLARQRRGRIDLRAAAVGQQERARPPPRFFAMRSG